MNCGIIQDLLPLYHDGVCSPESRTEVEEHLKTCPDCRAALAAWTRRCRRWKRLPLTTRQR